MSESAQPIEVILGSGYNAALVVAGGGSGAVQQLLSYPGASRFVLEVQIPYSPRAMFDYLGEELEKFCSAEAAETMAGRAFERALTFSLAEEMPKSILGVACTAALATDRERKGKDRAYLCFKARDRQQLHEIEFREMTRVAQEKQLSDDLLRLLSEFVAK